MINNETKVLLPYLDRPVAIHGRIALEYDFTYTHPVRQFNLSNGAKHLLREVMYGSQGGLNNLPTERLSQLPFIALYPLPEFLTHLPDCAIVIDGSIGGPSMWARLVAEREWNQGRPCLLLSHHGRTIRHQGEDLFLPEQWNKFTSLHLLRALIGALQPTRTLIVGLEIGAKLFDLLPGTRSILVETGFAEESILPGAVPSEISARALEELLFRSSVFPWDNLSCAIGAAECIRSVTLNVFWSEARLHRLRESFPDAPTMFCPPNFDIENFPERSASENGPLKIMAGTGNHTMGPKGMDFLSIRTLLDAARAVENCRVTLVTREPDRLRSSVAGLDCVEVVPHVPRRELAALYREHDLYYRVQNDASIPLSCMEAMACGLGVIISDRAKTTFSRLVDMENSLLAPFAQRQPLEQILNHLARDRGRLKSIGQAAANLARRHCDISQGLERIGWTA